MSIVMSIVKSSAVIFCIFIFAVLPAFSEQEEQEKKITLFDVENGKISAAVNIDILNIHDPVLAWNTFLGGEFGDTGYKMKVDGMGNIFVVGHSESSWGNPVRPFVGDQGYATQAFVAKFDGSGNFVWNTFLGGDSFETGYDIAIDNEGMIYVVGTSGGSWGNPLHGHSGRYDGYVAKLGPGGNLIWNTFYGCREDDTIGSLKLREDGYLYLSGVSGCSWGEPLKPYSGGGDHDPFIAKMDRNGSLLWHAFWGSEGTFWVSGFDFDSHGNIYVGGWSNQYWRNPVLPFSGFYDFFVAKFDPQINMQWHTYLGGGLFDVIYELAVDDRDNVYVGGYSETPWGNPLIPFSGAEIDSTVVKLNGSGHVLWHTFVGTESLAKCWMRHLTLDDRGGIYVTGEWTPWYASGIFTFVAKLDGDGKRLWKTLVGTIPQVFSGTMLVGFALDIDGDGNVCVLSDTWGHSSRKSPPFANPIIGPIGGNDAVLVKLNTPKADLVNSTVVDMEDPGIGEIITFSVNITNNGPDPTASARVLTALPPELAVVSVNPSRGAYYFDSHTWRIDALEVSGSAHMDLSVEVKQTGTFTSTFEILSQKAWDSQRDNDITSYTITGYPFRVFAPRDFDVRREVNNLIFSREYVNILTWNPNPENTSTIVGYRIFRKPGGAADDAYTLLAETDGGVFSYNDRGLDQNGSYVYKIVSVNDQGRQSKPVYKGV